ncbi:MAG: ParB/RepB/Spo0J family partition protein [Kofleriaceae bacterium]|nr:ParB/RepB/Spo0J family partition protein [Kofleriaceae bacterium]MBP6839381.1 ParB/RepB/Spo0J family partition protein [Kofleriaceae bacterium]
MNDKKRGLGRGLSALLPSAPPARPPTAPAPAPAPASAASAPVAAPASATPRVYFQANIEDVFPSPDQPRRRFPDAELDELAESIRAHGVIIPLVVRPRAAGGYLLIAGERRWRASQRAGLHQVPVVVQQVDGREAFERAIVENVQRADLSPLEEAAAYHRLTAEFGLSQEQVAARVGKDRSTVANAIRLLRLPPPVRVLVEDGRLSMGHARALLALPREQDLEAAAREVVGKALSVRATEALVRRWGKPAPAPTKAAAPAGKSAAVRDLEQRLTRALGGPVVIDEDAPGKGGRIEIRYHDLDHLDRLLDQLL